MARSIVHKNASRRIVANVLAFSDPGNEQFTYSMLSLLSNSNVSDRNDPKLICLLKGLLGGIKP